MSAELSEQEVMGVTVLFGAWDKMTEEDKEIMVHGFTHNPESIKSMIFYDSYQNGHTHITRAAIDVFARAVLDLEGNP